MSLTCFSDEFYYLPSPVFLLRGLQLAPIIIPPTMGPAEGRQPFLLLHHPHPPEEATSCGVVPMVPSPIPGVL